MQDQEHRALLERLFTVEHTADDRRVGEVVVARDRPSRFPASARRGGRREAQGQGSAHVVRMPSVLRRVLGAAGDVEVEPSAAELRERPAGVAGCPSSSRSSTGGHVLDAAGVDAQATVPLAPGHADDPFEKGDPHVELDLLRHPHAVIEQVGEAVAAACPGLDLEADALRPRLRRGS